MNIIYLHGFQSGPYSIKGQMLKQYFLGCEGVDVILPDLNMPPLTVIEKLSEMILSMKDVVLVGSSLGGFYATQLVAKHRIPAVLINPAMQPWHLFRNLFSLVQMPYQVTKNWSLDEKQLDQLEHIAAPFVQDADKIMVLLQQGDEVLDYREAERYYNRDGHQAFMITEANGNHAMDDFAEKIPMVYQFLADSLK